jgi:hypothetical protein
MWKPDEGGADNAATVLIGGVDLLDDLLLEREHLERLIEVRPPE